MRPSNTLVTEIISTLYDGGELTFDKILRRVFKHPEIRNELTFSQINDGLHFLVKKNFVLMSVKTHPTAGTYNIYSLNSDAL